MASTTSNASKSTPAEDQRLPCGRLPKLPLWQLRLPVFDDLPAELRPPSEFEPDITRDDLIKIPPFEKLPSGLKNFTYPLPPRMYNGFPVTLDHLIRLLQDVQRKTNVPVTDHDTILEWSVNRINRMLSPMVGCPVEVKAVLNDPSGYVLSLRSNDHPPRQMATLASEHVEKLREILGLSADVPIMWYICKERWFWGRWPGSMM